MIYDISCPITSNMWTYRNGWENEISHISSTHAGDQSTTYRFSLCSHTGTYIETSQHKLPTNVNLEHFTMNSFVRRAVLIQSARKGPMEAVHLAELITDLRELHGCTNIALIIATGWGSKVTEKTYLSESPYFSEELTSFLCTLDLGLLGVDIPIIDYQPEPYNAVVKLFQHLPNLLLLAPLVIDTTNIYPGNYTLIAQPLKISDVCATPCRPLLIGDMNVPLSS